MKFLIMMSFLVGNSAWSQDVQIKSTKENLTEEKSINELFNKLFSFQEKHKPFRTTGVLDENFTKAKKFFSNLEEKDRLYYGSLLLDMMSNNIGSVIDEIYQVSTHSSHGNIKALFPYEMKLATTKNVLVILKSNGIEIPENIISLIKRLKNVIEETKTKINVQTK